VYGSPPLRQLLSLVLLVVVGLVLPYLLPEYFLYLGNVLMMYAVLAIGLDILVGGAGQFAVAHTAFFGIGCYATAQLGARFGIPFVIGMPLGALLAGAVAMAIALPATRLREVYLALATYAFAEFAQWVFNSWTPVTNGVDGVKLQPSNVFGLTIVSDTQAFPVMAFILAMVIAATLYLTTSRFGRSMAAVRESEHVAMASGIDVRWVKVTAFAISGVYAGIAGGMFTLYQSFVDPEQFGFVTIVLLLTMIVVGGLGTLPGVLIGVVVLGLLPELLRTVLRSLQIWQELAYGIILILTMMYMPRGVWGFIQERRRSARR
jgi:branched-chain amino acid transport system permease protein